MGYQSQPDLMGFQFQPDCMGYQSQPDLMGFQFQPDCVGFPHLGFPLKSKTENSSTSSLSSGRYSVFLFTAVCALGAIVKDGTKQLCELYQRQASNSHIAEALSAFAVTFQYKFTFST